MGDQEQEILAKVLLFASCWHCVLFVQDKVYLPQMFSYFLNSIPTVPPLYLRNFSQKPKIVNGIFE